MAIARSALHRVLQALARAGHGFARLARRLVVERLARRLELGLGALQLLAQRLRHANVLLLVALQLALHPLVLPLRFALDGLALLFGLAPRGFVLALGLTLRLLVLPQSGFVLAQRRLVLPDGLFVLALGFTLRLLLLLLRFAQRLFVLLHRLAVRLLVLLHRLAVCLLVLALCLFVLPLRLAHRLFVLLHRFAVRLLVLALPQLILALAFALRLDVLALTCHLRPGQRLAQLLHLAFGLRELVLGRFDACRGAFEQLEGVFWDGLGSGDDGGEDTQSTAGKDAGEHESLRGERAPA